MFYCPVYEIIKEDRMEAFVDVRLTWIYVCILDISTISLKN